MRLKFCSSKIVEINSTKRLNFSKRTNKTRHIKIIKSIARSNIIVPKSLSTGMFSVWFKLVQRVISPALGIAMFVK